MKNAGAAVLREINDRIVCGEIFMEVSSRSRRLDSGIEYGSSCNSRKCGQISCAAKQRAVWKLSIQTFRRLLGVTEPLWLVPSAVTSLLNISPNHEGSNLGQ